MGRDGRFEHHNYRDLFRMDLSIPLLSEQLCKLWIELLIGCRRKLCCLCRGEGC